MNKKLGYIIIILCITLVLAIIFCILGYQLSKQPLNTTAETIAETKPTYKIADNPNENSVIVVLDPGHGKSSSAMTETEKRADGWIFNSASNSWGEWRHWKSAAMWKDCQGTGCTGRAPKGGSCWYPIGHGDRDTEPDINLHNSLAAKAELEKLGYTVRLTRETNNTNPSMTKRLTYCYPNGDITKEPDADYFICLHSNAGGGKGSCYISLSGLYDQAGIPEDYIAQGNTLGKTINDKIINDTSLLSSGNGEYSGYPELVLFCKSPIPIAYLEIGFYDNSADLQILNSESEKIGQAIAHGIDEYIKQN